MKQKRKELLSIDNNLNRPRIFSTAVMVEAKTHTVLSLRDGSWKTFSAQGMETVVEYPVCPDTCNDEIPYIVDDSSEEERTSTNGKDV